MSRFDSAIGRFDASADRALARVRGPRADRVFYAASEVGDFSLLWHWVSWTQALRPGHSATNALRASVLLGVESALVNGPIKSLFKRSRPVIDVPRPRQLRQPRTSSFPSGHASAAFTFVGTSDPDDPIRPVLYGVASVVAISRAYVKIHHASDVIGGVATGVVLGWVFRKWWPVGSPLPHPFVSDTKLGAPRGALRDLD